MNDFVPLTGEPLAIDLINTQALLPRIGWVDALGSVAQLRLWLGIQHERLSVHGDSLTRADLTAVHRLRDDVAAAVDRSRHGSQPTATSLRGINKALRQAPPVRRLRWSNDRLEQQLMRPSGSGRRLLSQLSEAAADLLVDPAVEAIRDCAMPDCVMLFYPNHARRKWCSDAICGNRSRVARHYQRHRVAADR